MTDTAQSRRIEWIDLARGIALVAMATYHFSWDLEFFGYLAPGTAGAGPLKWYARSIASSFLILVGISLVLAHWRGVRWSGYFRRLGLIVASAVAISAATIWFSPDAWVFFGILHQIAFATVFGLLFVRLPWPALAAIAVVWFSVPLWGKADLFSAPYLTWIGLSPFPPRSNDFVPVFPWFAAVLAGMALGRLLVGTSAADRLRSHPPARNATTRVLQFLGRHSLATYLIHQPVLIACVYLFTLISPPDPADGFARACVASCSASNDTRTCEVFCDCALLGLEEKGLLERVYRGEINQANNPDVAAVTDQCSIEAAPNGN